MKHEKLTDALSHLQDRHISEAAHYKKRSHLRWMAPIAAVLALTILASTLWRPLAPTADPTIGGSTGSPTIDHSIQKKHLIAKAEYPKLAKNPAAMQGGDYTAWLEDQTAMHTQPVGYIDALADFWLELNQALLKNTCNKNITYSPANIYMALAMLAETTGGESRQQILDVLGAGTIESLRVQANQVWQGHYNDDGLSTSILANSLWLQENYGFNPDIATLLAQNYYASIFQGDLGSQEMTEALRAWLDEQTGGLLTEQLEKVSMNPNTVLALASTIYYQVQWIEEFKEEKNTEGVFHGANNNTTETFMNKVLTYGPYFWGEHFGAVALNLEDGSRMWLFLPDEGVAPEAIVEEVHAFLQAHPYQYQSGYEKQKDIRINLSLPKFDICADLNLRDTLEKMGVTDIFDVNEADFTPILAQKDEGYISEVKHAARVTIDEKGVTAAAFTLILRAGAAPPPADEIDFVLDRPFLFCVESQDDLPLFTGIVNEP